MNENELKSIWQSSYQKIEVNRKNTEEITKLNVQNALSSMKPVKLFALVIGVFWVIALGSLLVYLIVSHFGESSKFFLGSATIQLLLTAIAVGIYINQLILISRIDFSESIINIQAKVIKLKLSTLNATRLLFLQLPVWTTFYWTEDMFVAENWEWWMMQLIVTATFTVLALWLYTNIKFENSHKKWFKVIFRGKEWEPILHSMEILNQFEHNQDYNKNCD